MPLFTRCFSRVLVAFTLTVASPILRAQSVWTMFGPGGGSIWGWGYTRRLHLRCTLPLYIRLNPMRVECVRKACQRW